YYLGEIIAFAGIYVPQNFQLCDGTLLKITDNEALYSVIGTKYGGDGSTTFGVPNLQNLIVVGTGNSKSGTPYPLAANGGTNNVTLVANELPSHTHAFMASSNNATTGDPNTNVLAASVPASGSAFSNANVYITGVTPNATLNQNSVSFSGGNMPHEN